MGSLGNIFLKFSADVSDLKSGVKNIDTSLQEFKKHAEGIGSSLKFVEATAGLGLLKTAFDSVSGIASSLIAEFDADAKAGAKLTQALYGNTEGAKELLEQASKLQTKRLFPDEVTANADALLASLGLETQSIKTLIPLVQDFASTFGIDLDTATKTVGKSIVTGSNALKKFGIDIGETHSAAERYTATVKALSAAMEGQAEVAGRVGAGPLQLLSQQFSEIKEISGEALVKFVGVFLPAAETGVDSLKEKLTGVPDKFEKIAKSILPLITFFSKISEYQDKIARGLGLGKLSESLTGIKENSDTPKASNRSDLAKTIADINKQKADAKTLAAELARIRGKSDGEGKGDKGSGLSFLQELQRKESEVNKIFSRLEPKITSFQDKLASIFEDRGRTPADGKIAAQLAIIPAALQNATTYVRPLNDQITALNTTFINLKPAISASLEEFSSGFLKTKEAVDAVNASLSQIIESGIENTLSGIGTQLGNVFSGDKFDFGSLLAPLADVLIEVGKLAIATGIAVEGIKKALVGHPVAAILGGIALIALGTFVKSSLANKSAKFAKGGLSYGEHLATVGDNPNARFDPEVTAPSSKLKSIFENVSLPKLSSLIPNTFNTGSIQSQAITLDGTFRIDGKDLVLAFDRQRATQLRQRGY